MISPLIQELRSLRQQAGVSQERLGQLANVGQGHIAKIENGRHDPRLSTVEKLFHGLGYKITVQSEELESLRMLREVNRKLDLLLGSR